MLESVEQQAVRRAVAEEQERFKRILALPLARALPDLAARLAGAGLTVEQASDILDKVNGQGAEFLAKEILKGGR